MMKFSVAKFAAILGLGLLSACVTSMDATGPASQGKITEFDLKADVLDETSLVPGKRPPIASLEGSLWAAMDKAENATKTSGNRIIDPALNTYVSGIVCKLAGNFCPHIRTYIMCVPAFNANMAPNGVMQIWTGLLLRVRDEAQLASVLGHEIGHFLLRHSRARMQQQIDQSNALLFLKMAVAVAGIPADHTVTDLLALGVLRAYGREHERESDLVGLRLLVKNGYDPWAAQNIWIQLRRENKPDKGAAPRSYFLATHPSPTERIDNLGAMARYAEKHISRKDRGLRRYEKAVFPLRMMLLQDEMNLRQFDRSQKLLTMLIRGGRHVGQLHFFRGETYRLRGGDGDLEKAMQSYRIAVERQAAPAIAYRSMGRVLDKLGKKAEARNAYRTYLEISPDAEDRKIIEFMLDGLS